MSALWKTRVYRTQRALSKLANDDRQTFITDFFDISSVYNIIDENECMRTDVNNVCGVDDPTISVAPIMQRLYENALANAANKSKKANRHDVVIKKFAASLFCIIGKSGYELLSKNLGSAFPCLRTVQREIATKKRVNEGEFQFDALKEHLMEWRSPHYVHVQLDDTRIIHKVEYDHQTNRFIGFCLPMRDGIPVCDAFVLDTFEDIKDAVESNEATKYAHCILAQPIDGVSPSTILFVLGTDSKYDSDVIVKRWRHIEKELLKRSIRVVSFGADGAGPFMKSMLTESALFRKDEVELCWSFFKMPLRDSCLSNQDTVHLLAKLKNKLLTPSNLIVIGRKVACPAHLITLLETVPKSQHCLTRKAVDNKDKQNYGSITLLVDAKVESCLNQLDDKYNTRGTIMYLSLMRNIRDATFDKAISPIKRIYLMWYTIYFLRIWRTFLLNEGCRESEHFITSNAYLCVELNGHMMINTVVNVIKGIFPIETLRFWLPGSQACEQKFRLLRAMTPTFSTIVNFTLKGVLHRLHKLSYLSSCEASDDIVFPRVQRKLLQLNEETTDTFKLPTIQEIFDCVQNSKTEAIKACLACGINLDKYDGYDDSVLVVNTQSTIDVGGNEVEVQDPTELNDSLSVDTSVISQKDTVVINEDLVHIRLRRSSIRGLPTYLEQNDVDETSQASRSFNLVPGNRNFSAFVRYENSFIRKTTALYLLQEHFQVSSDRLLRVRRDQPDHLFSVTEIDTGYVKSCVRSGDLCIFQRVDRKRKMYLVGRVIQFSYLSGSKKDRQYSSDYVDMTKDSYKNIGLFANWYVGVYSNSFHGMSLLPFKPLEDLFTIGYLSMEQYVSTVDEESLVYLDDFSFGLPYAEITKIVPKWFTELTLEKEECSA